MTAPISNIYGTLGSLCILARGKFILVSHYHKSQIQRKLCTMPSKTISYCLCVLVSFLLINLRPNWKQLLLLSGLSLLIGVGSLLTKLLLAAYFWRRLIVLDSNGKKELLGQPLLFPARLSHARRFPEPERYNYWYDYFLVGIPVGLRGRIGTLLSIDNLPACETRREKCWFTIDPAYYLDPGSGDRSLEEKLRIFLERQASARPQPEGILLTNAPWYSGRKSRGVPLCVSP